MLIIDIETTGLKPWDSDIRLITCLEGSCPSFYTQVTPELQQKLADENLVKVFHNASFDVGFLEWKGYTVSNVECTWVMAKVLEEWSCKLKDLAEKYLGIIIDKDLQHGDNWLQELTQEHYDYALKDVEVTQQLYHELKKQLEDKGLLQVYLRENEANASISKLNNHGICFDVKGWDSVWNDDRHEMVQREEDIKKLLQNEEINLNSPQQLIQAFQNLGLDIPSTSDDVLALHEDKHPVLPLLRKYRRKGIKVRTYGDKLQDAICSDGRLVHALKSK